MESSRQYSLVFVVFALVVGGIVGYVIRDFSTLNKTQVKEKSVVVEKKIEEKSDHTADHTEIEVNTDLPLPSVSLILEKDKMAGYNVIVNTDNFTFTPEKVNLEPVSNEGHAHLYVDDVKITRLYGQYYHLNNLSRGEHEIKVTLNANDHADWMYQGEHIQAVQKVTVE